MTQSKRKDRKGKKKGVKKGQKEKEGDSTPATAPKLKPMKNPIIVDEGSKLIVKCEATGSPLLTYTWFKDGNELKKSRKVRIKNGQKNSRVQISRAKLEDSGNYTCVVENKLGKDNSTGTVNVQSITTTPSPGSGHARRCNDTEKAYCVNGGDCYFIHGINQLSCKCPDGYFGPRCLQTEPLRLYMPNPFKKAEELYQKRVLTITGICVALLVVGIVCVVAYCKTKHEERTWSLEHSDSILSDSPGIMSSSVGTSKCSSPACMEARARRAAHCGYSDPPIGRACSTETPSTRWETLRTATGHRYVSALTTPARLSPVDFHYSLPSQVPTFQITSPNASHAMSLPPAVHNPYPLEDDQPLLRRYQVPLHDAQCQEPYRQQRRTYLNDSRGSLPPPAPTGWLRMKTMRPPKSISPLGSNQREVGPVELVADAGGDPD
ncbi:hypothetical protein L3Q82_006481 [Scortum barcoo]|uniref:Uncharacterized protein n=1 Tax=Scortum barcoo TaxID=214431 RepID=A0ACB8WZE2_9TELE|nr:hypothetical protein L3Q82_006481 [Scortum barcoo]